MSRSVFLRSARSCLLVCALLLPTAVRAADGDITGWWFDETKRAAIKLAPCGDRICGKIGWMREPLDDTGQVKRDIKNDNQALKSRPLCQMPMLGDFRKVGPGEWEDGWIYNPEDGDTYKSKMGLQPDGTLRVRGFIGVPWLGKSQVWTRPSAPPEDCVP